MVCLMMWHAYVDKGVIIVRQYNNKIDICIDTLISLKRADEYLLSRSVMGSESLGWLEIAIRSSIT